MPFYAMPTARPLEMRELQKIPLIELQLPKPFREYNASKREALAELGFTYGVRAAVQFDRPEIREKINQQESIVKSDPFTAELPGWPVRPVNCQVGLSEIAFGLSIEESLSRDMEVQYAQYKNDAGVFAENDLS
jgi:hypothetical protein